MILERNREDFGVLVDGQTSNSRLPWPCQWSRSGDPGGRVPVLAGAVGTTLWGQCCAPGACTVLPPLRSRGKVAVFPVIFPKQVSDARFRLDWHHSRASASRALPPPLSRPLPLALTANRIHYLSIAAFEVQCQ